MNTQSDHDIKRYIYSSDQNISLDANGLLITYEYFQETKLIPVQDLKDMQGGIILAEGGIGKTTFVKQLNVLLGEQSKMFELGLYSADPSILKEEIDKFILNYTDNKTPVIILDGLDEAPDLSGILIRILRIHNSDAVFWLTSRDIPEIRRIQDENRALNTYSLAPLSVDGIKNIAAENNIDHEDFIKTSYEKGVLGLCVKPIVCNFVINAYKNDKLKNSSYKDIWYKGILNLCDENDAANKARVEEPSFTIQDIFKCSAWIALCLSLGGKSLLWVDEPSRCKESYISLDEMIVENIPLKLLRLTVKRGIFTPIGNGTVRFTHATYQDYLSAYGLKLFIKWAYWSQIIIDRSNNKVFPCYEGIASWLAVLDEDFLNEIKAIQVELLLPSQDIIDHLSAENVCTALFSRCESLSYKQRHSPKISNNLFRLKSLKTAELIKEIISDKNAGNSKTEFAIEIAEACEFKELSVTIMDLVLDESINYHRRVDAAYAVRRLNEDEANRKMLKLFPISAEDDPYDNLRGNALRCLWPKQISVQELADNLVEPNKRNFSGAYQRFINDELPATFEDCIDVGKAGTLLNWAIKHLTDSKPFEVLGDLARDVYTFCWKWADNRNISTLLAKGYVKAVSKYISPFTEKRSYFPKAHYLSKETFLENVGYRMTVLEHVLSDTEITTLQIEHIRVNAYPLYTHDDIDFLLDEALKCAEPEIASKWIRCINTAFWNVTINSFSEKINRLNAKYPDLIKIADDIQTDIEQSRLESKRMQEEWQAEDEIRQQKAEDKQRKIDKEIKIILKKNEIPADLFWNISNWLDSEGGHAVLSSPDLRESTGWKKINENEKKSLIKLAFRFLNECEFQKSNVKSYNIPITIAQAFILVYYNDKSKFEMISESVWKKCGFELLKIPFNDFLELLAPVYDYFKINYTELAGQTILEVLDQELEKGYVTIISNWANRLTDDIVNKIIKRIGKDDVTLDSQYSVLSSLAEFGFTDEVVVFLNGILTEETIFEQSFFKHLGLLFNLSPQHSTEFILNRIKTDVEWGRSWVETISGRDEYSLYNGVQKCRPEEIAEFYIWLEQEYPPSTQPEHDGVYSPSALDNIHLMKNHLLRHLSGSGEIGTSEAIQKIISRYPDKEWLKDCLFEAETAELNQKTSNISISDLKELSLSRSENKLLINNIYDLHRVVLDSLDDYQQYLQGDNPAIRDLWDTKNNPVPKNEEDLSDHIQRYLKFKLTPEMIVNREVTISRKLYKEGNSGSIPDLWVQVANKNIGQLSLCIEVKCNWNDSAETAIKKQLIDKYMSGGTAHAGILLLGWFDCDKWGESDPRKKKVKDIWPDIKSAESDLVKQAEAERNNGHFVSSKVIDCSIA